mgnify:CR=1 FL=1
METTLNIRIELLEKIKSTARERNISRSELIIDLLQKIMTDELSRVKMGKQVRYQEKRRPDDRSHTEFHAARSGRLVEGDHVHRSGYHREKAGGAEPEGGRGAVPGAV